MKITIDRKKFLRELEIAGKFVDLKAKGEHNGVFILASENGEIILGAVNNGKGYDAIKYKVKSACVDEAGDIFIEFNKLKMLLKSVSANEVILEDRALKFGGGEIKFELLSREELPEYPEIEHSEELYEMPAKELKRLLSDVMTAMAVPTGFPKYAGMCLLRSGRGQISAVATDGKRLSLAKYFCGNIKDDKDLILGSESVKGLEKALGFIDGDVKISFDGHRVWIKSDDAEILAMNKDNVSFPLYERILNKTVETSLVCLKKDLEEAVKKVYTVAKTMPSRVIGLKFYPGKGAVIAAHSVKSGDITTTFSKGKIEGKNLMLGVNAQYFLEVLKTLGDGEIIIEFSGEEAQIRFYRANDKAGLEYLLMPCRLVPADRVLIDIGYPED